MALSRTFISHSLILAPGSEISDTALAVWLVLRRNPRTDNNQWCPVALGRIAAACGFDGGAAGVKRVGRALRCLAAAGVIDFRQHKTRRGTHNAARCTRIPAANARRVESVPGPVFELLANGTITPVLLRSWLRWLTALRGGESTVRTSAEAGALWGQSVRTVSSHRRQLVALDLLWTDTGRTGVSWLRWWGSEAPASKDEGRQLLSGGPGNFCPVNSSLDNSSRQQPPAGLVPAPQTAPGEAAAKAPAERVEGSSQGGRRATEREQRVGRWMASNPALGRLTGPVRWQCRSALAALIGRVPAAPEHQLLERVAHLITQDLPHGGGRDHVRIIRAAAAQVASEAKAGTLTAQPAAASAQTPSVEYIYDAAKDAPPLAAPDQTPAPQVGAAPAPLMPDWSNPDADLGAISIWIHAAVGRADTPARAAAITRVIREATRTSPHSTYVASILTRTTASAA